RESSQIDALNRDIAENRQRVRLLRAEISRLEQPSRLETLSREAGLAPVDVHRQATEDQLPALKEAKAPALAAPAPKPAPVVVAEDPGAPL
ncbi:MAG TPA: cell division protein, partial [Brevundimonas sp.]